MADVTPERELFVRKATGLVRGWSTFDGFVYAAMTINPIVLGLYIYSFAPFIPNGSLFWATIISAVFIAFEVVVYAALIACMPRAGGDYVWQTRFLHGSIGFVLAATGWWFILWHWTPIYAAIMVYEVFNPLLAIVGANGLASWFTGQDGIFASCLMLIALVTAYIAIGMRGYARIQRICFFAGLGGILAFFILLLVNGKSDFAAAFNREASDLYGAGPNAFQETMSIGGYDSPFLGFSVQATFLLIPMVVFWNLWPNWGATLYGEVRGAGDLRKNLLAMGSALVSMTILALILFGLIAKTMGWDFYQAANNAYWGTVYGYNLDGAAAPLSAWPYPVMFAGWLVNSAAFQFIFVAVMGLWFIGFSGTLFLSSTRMIFASAFDRVLPEWAATVSPRFRVPTGALLLMSLPSVVVSALYAYWGSFATYTLDAVLVIAVTFLGSALAAAVMPWTAKRIYRASPLVKYEWKGVPLITVLSFVFGGFLAYNLVLWFKDDVYGVNNRDSLIYMGIMYALAIGIYVVARIVRARQGMPLDRVHREIPAE